MSKETDLAWAAGFIDGEGCIRIHKSVVKNRPTHIRYALIMTAVQTHPRPIYKLKGMFGGSITEYDKGIYKRQWVWKVGAQDCKRALNLLLPYFVVKTDQAAAGLKFQEIIDSNISRKKRSEETTNLMETYYLKLKELKGEI